MLSNRTYLGIKDTYLEVEALKECALSRALHREKVHTRRSDRAFFQHTQDRRALMGAYKKLREYFENGGEFSPTADILCDNFYVVEKNMIALINGASDIKMMRLPVFADGDLMLLPRVYGIAVDMVGHREGRIDESLIEQYMEAYQSIMPLTLRETAALPYMIKTALVKLVKIESDECIASMKAMQKAEGAVQTLIKYRDDLEKQNIFLNRLHPEKEAALLDRMVHMLADKNEYVLLERVYSELERTDIDAETLIANDRRAKNRSAMLMMNAINSLRVLDAMDYEALFGKICAVEHELDKDALYSAADKSTRAYYRSCVEQAARQLRTSEISIAKKAVMLADKNGIEGGTGYYLFQNGKKELYESVRPDKTYREYSHGKKLWTLICAQIALMIPLLLLARTGGIIPLMLSVFPAWTVANFAVVRIAVKLSTVKMIPRLSMKNGIGEENRTLTVVPSLICSGDDVAQAIETIETHYLSNPLDNCYFAILSDFSDSKELVNDGEEELLRQAKTMTAKLNAKYSKGTPIFYYLHRGRQYLISDDIYMGRERKRGALMALAEYIVCGESSQFVFISDPLPENIKYCLTLDSDTVLNKETLSELIGAAAHPLNKPVLDERGVVVKGYGIIAPKMRTLASSAAKSRFARLYSNDIGLDIYSSAASEFYQDIFGEGIFGGKGIFDVDVFYSSLKMWIADNTVLSHDLIEGSFLRAGYMSDVVLYDSTPTDFIAWWKRSHRWMRGDWQLLPYLWFNIKDAGGAWRKNPLNVLSRWKILENIRRTMLCSSILYTLFALPYIGFGFYALIALAAFWEDAVIDLVEFFAALIFSHRERYNAGGLLKERINTFKKSIALLAALPYETERTGDAAARALYRMFISHRKMLEWQTASHSVGRAMTVLQYYKKMYVCPLAALVMAVSIFIGKTPLVSLFFALLFMGAPALMHYLGKGEESEDTDGETKEFLMSVARSTWRYFATLCNEKTAYLPPDNYQKAPEKPPVLHTSPTNIGMGLLANLSAYDLGFIGRDELLLRSKRMLVSIENAEKWHGHLYNWYALPSLEVLPARYVSTVDSGNLAASLLTLEQALYELNADALASCAGALARNMDFTYLYDKSRSQFHIGYDAQANELSKSWYDLLASESRLTTVTAIALGQVNMKAYYSLSRLLVPTDKGRTLISWSGTMFEYLMPLLFSGAIKGTLLYETAQNAVKTQMAYTKDIWGISESGYYAFDKQRYYQYRAFGVPKLSLMPTHEKELVIAPYASALALMVNKNAAAKNLRRLSKLGMFSKYGMYEALDMSPSRTQGREFEKVASFMAHHQGMTLCAINNIFSKNNITTRFLSVPEIRSVRMLFEEKRPSMAITIKEFESSVYKNSTRTEDEYKPRRVEWNSDCTDEGRLVKTQLLSNGEYSVLLGDDLSGCSKCCGVMLSRYRRENNSHSGIKFYIRNDSKVLSMSDKDADLPDSGEIVLEPHGVKFSRRDGEMTSRLDVCVAPEHNAEIRRLTVANHTGENMEIEVGIFFEVCLASYDEDVSHSAFVKVRLDVERKDGGLLYRRRMKNSDGKEQGRFMYAKTVCTDENAIIKYCADRLVMPGRCRSEKDAMRLPILNDREDEAPTETGFCSRITLNIKPESTQSVTLVMGFARSEKQALSDAAEVSCNIDNILALAWNYSKNILNFEGISKGKADMFEKAASCLFDHVSHKGHEKTNCAGGIEQLWKLGISGDKPIISMTVSKITQSRIVKTLIEFIAYINARGVEAELVLIGDYRREYSNELKRRLEELISVHARVMENVRLLHGYDLTDEEKELIRALSSMVIDNSKSLDKQFLLVNDDGEKIPQRVYPLLGKQRGCFAPSRRELEFYNGYGGFDTNKNEYVIYKNKEMPTPLPWCNILANENFGSVITENGGGFTWHLNSRLNKLTHANFEPIYDEPSEEILICDNESGHTWNVCGCGTGNETHHGIGYTRFVSNEDEIKSELLVFVDAEKSVKYSVLTLSNPMMRKRTLSIAYGIEWCLGEKMHSECVQTEFEDGLLFARSLRKKDSGEYAYMAICTDKVEYTGDRKHIKSGALHAERLNGRVGLGLGGVGMQRCETVLGAGETKSIVFVLGRDTKENAKEMRKNCSLEYIDQRKALLDEIWRERLLKLQVKTGDGAMDIMLNVYLLYSLYSSRLFGKTGYFQCGGATGFRDQLQDALALKLTADDKLKAQIIKCASKQFTDGDVLHWWHERNLGIRTRCSDDKLFLPYAVCEYIAAADDFSILDEKVTYLNDMPLGEKESVYADMSDSFFEESIYEHCVRALKSALVYGEHSLLLMGSCDWNDSMDDAGKGGGESVWLSMFMIYILREFKKLAVLRADTKRVSEFSKAEKRLCEAVENEGFDGAWYKRAYLSDGTSVGSHQNDECSIDILSQAWSVFINAQHSREAFDSAAAMLVDTENGIIKLLAPPFDRTEKEIGYIEEYIPGVRENGGQYTHAAAWFVISACKLGLKTEAYDYFSMLNPINHSKDLSGAKRYKTEPYALCGDVYSVGRNSGRGGWPHYTGANGWLYSAGIEHILGIKKHGGRLIIKPQAVFDEFTVEYKHGDALHRIKVVRDELGEEFGIVELDKESGEYDTVLRLAY